MRLRTIHKVTMTSFAIYTVYMPTPCCRATSRKRH